MRIDLIGSDLVGRLVQYREHGSDLRRVGAVRAIWATEKEGFGLLVEEVQGGYTEDIGWLRTISTAYHSIREVKRCACGVYFAEVEREGHKDHERLFAKSGG